MGKISRMRLRVAALICAASFLCVTFANVRLAVSGQTSGGVTWADPLAYTKPQFVPLTVPDEATCPNKYYVDFSSGSGSTCSQASPCATFRSLAGKAGISGGPAYVYVRGSGSFQWDSNYPGGSNATTMYGSSGNEIVIKPWPGYTATLTYNMINANGSDSSRFQHIIWDGGANMGITFFSGSNSYNGAWNFSWEISNDNLSNWTFYRTKWRCGSGQGQLFKGYGRSSNIRFINNEFYDCTSGDNSTGHQFYIAAATNGGSWPNDCSATSCAAINYTIKNNIYRDNNNGIEVNVRDSTAAYQVDGLLIEGNAIHNVGKGLCGTNWQCRPGITLSNTSNGNPQWRNVTIRNNMVWDTASGAIWVRAGSPEIYNNSITAWGVGSGSAYNQAIGGAGYPTAATARNNIIYDGTKDAFDNLTGTKTNNMCGSGESCGTSPRTYDSNVFVSTDPNNSGFLKLKSGSAAIGYGYDLSALFTSSYFGGVRRTPFDIGADQYGSAGGDTGTPPEPPTNLRVQ